MLFQWKAVGSPHRLTDVSSKTVDGWVNIPVCVLEHSVLSELDKPSCRGRCFMFLLPWNSLINCTPHPLTGTRTHRSEETRVGLQECSEAQWNLKPWTEQKLFLPRWVFFFVHSEGSGPCSGNCVSFVSHITTFKCTLVESEDEIITVTSLNAPPQWDWSRKPWVQSF